MTSVNMQLCELVPPNDPPAGEPQALTLRRHNGVVIAVDSHVPPLAEREEAPGVGFVPTHLHETHHTPPRHAADCTHVSEGGLTCTRHAHPEDERGHVYVSRDVDDRHTSSEGVQD